MVKKNVVTPVTDPEPAQEPQTPDYEKRFEELNSTISEQGKTIEQMQEFVAGASVVINTIAANPTLKQGFQQALGGQPVQDVSAQQPPQGNPPQGNGQPPQSQDYDTTRKVDDVVASQRESIIRDFENTYGIKSDETGRAQKQKIAEYLSSFGWKVADLPLSNLRESLDKAYMGSVGVEKLREEGKLEGITTAMTNNMGMVGSFASGAPNPQSQTGELTDKQKEWIKKLGVDEEGAKKIYNERDGEETKAKGQ